MSALLCAPGHRAEPVEVNAVLGGREPACAARASANGYRTLKLKLAAEGDADERTRIAAVRRAIGPGPRLRLDPNGAWSPDRALRVLEQLAPHDIELCEQPVAARDLEGFARVQRQSPIPLAADESLGLAEGRAACAAGELGAFAILKPTVLGGLEAARALAAGAERNGVRAIVTTTFDGPLGTAAALALAAAVGTPAHAHGLDAASWMSDTFPAELVPRSGQLQPRRAPGWPGLV